MFTLMSCPNKWFGKLFHSLKILTKEEYLNALIPQGGGGTPICAAVKGMVFKQFSLG